MIQAIYKLIEYFQTLNEMGTLCDKNDGIGFNIQVYTKDHPPPHAHVLTWEENKKKLQLKFKMLIPQTEPKSFEDIKPYGKYTITNEDKKIIYKWCMSSKIIGQIQKTPNWTRLIDVWNALHPNPKHQIK